MIKINLLPHREVAKKRREEAFKVLAFCALLVGVAISFFVYTWFQTRISVQEARNRTLSTENAKLDAQIKEVDTLEAEINALKSRQQAVEELQANRNMSVHLFNQLSQSIPEGSYLLSLKQTGTQILVDGVAQSNERISELLRNVGEKSEWFSNPELIEIVAKEVKINQKNSQKINNFKAQMVIKKIDDKESNKSSKSGQN